MCITCSKKNAEQRDHETKEYYCNQKYTNNVIKNKRMKHERMHKTCTTKRMRQPKICESKHRNARINIRIKNVTRKKKMNKHNQKCSKRANEK